jgi:hypothetical protein
MYENTLYILDSLGMIHPAGVNQSIHNTSSPSGEFSCGVVLRQGNPTHTIVFGCTWGISAKTDTIRQA